MIASRGERVPRVMRKNLDYRRYVLQRARKSANIRKGLLAACAEDPLFFVNTFVWQYNPTKLGQEVEPFVSWDFQDEALLAMNKAIEEGSDLFIEKSREMGASWLCLIAFFWRWRFKPMQKFLAISRSEDAVDKPDDPDSLFWKLDFIIKYLPGWMMEGYKPTKHRKKMVLIHPTNGSVITGQASTGKAGVGGRATAMFIDEFSQIREDYEVLQRTSDTTKCRIFNGTHLGLNTAFYALSQSPVMKKLVMHWTQHPEKRKGLYRYDHDNSEIRILDKNYVFDPDYPFVKDGAPTGGPYPGIRSPWYDKQCERKASTRAVAMDLDINPTGSISQYFDPITIRMLQHEYCSPPLWVGDVHYDKDSARDGRLVRDAGGNLKLWIIPRGQGEFPSIRAAVGCDISHGTGSTPSTISIVDANARKKIGEFSNAWMDPDDFAIYVVALCRMLRNDYGESAMLIWEAAGPGIKFGQTVEKVGYLDRSYFKIDEFGTEKKRSDKPGWYPSPNAKNTLLMAYQKALSSRRFMNPSKSALDECLAFMFDARGFIVHSGEIATDDPTKARHNHGDMVIADALAVKMAEEMGSIDAVKDFVPEVSPRSFLWRRQMRQEREQQEWLN